MIAEIPAPDDGAPDRRLIAARREQTPQALARLVIVALFISLWFVLWFGQIPMPRPFLLALCAEATFFIVYWRLVFVLPTLRSIEVAHYVMLAAEIVFHTTMVYFLGGVMWLGAFAYVFGLIFTNTFLDLRRGLIYTLGASSAFVTLVLLDATGVIPHYGYLPQDTLRYTDPRFVTTTTICAAGVFFSIYVWVNWVGHQLRQERDTAVHTHDELLAARRELERANAGLEVRVAARTADLEEANAALADGEQLLAATIESTADGILVVNSEGRPVYGNRRFLEMWRIPEDVFASDDDDQLRAFVADQLADPGAFEATVIELYQSAREDLDSLEFKDGRVFERYSRPLMRDGEMDGRVWSFRDVSERTRAAEALRASEERLRAVITNAPVVLFALDKEGVFTLSEGKALDSLGIAPEQLVGRSIDEVYAQYPQAIDQMRRALAGETFSDTVEFGGVSFEAHYSPVFTRGGAVAGVTGVAIDVTARLRAEEVLRDRASRDPLTHTLNHAAIADQLRDLIASIPPGDSVSVVVADVDGMKAVNDTYGHQFGDRALVLVAKALIRPGAVVGRYGGDEFLVVVPHADRAVAEAYCRDVEDALGEGRVTDVETGSQVPIVLSLGVAVYPDEAKSLDDLIRLADSAMYTTKRRRPSADAISRSLADERAAKMVGQIVPLLTSPGDLSEKLRLVSHRLSSGAGYDRVHIDMFGAGSWLGGEDREPIVERRRSPGRRDSDRSPLRTILESTGRPVIIDAPSHDARVDDAERETMDAAGIKSALIVPMYWQGDLVGMLSVGSKAPSAFTPRDAHFLTAVASQVMAIIQMSTLADGLQRASAHLAEAQAETVMMLAAAAEAHDHTTGRHLWRVRAVSQAIASELGYDEEAAKELGLAAVLHDIGKIRVPDNVLSSSSLLNEDEWIVMKQHTVWGAEFLRGREGFALAAAVAESHHERWDGTGYPRGLAALDIPEAATIVSVADSFDAMTNDRPYRVGHSVDWALQEISASAGTQFSPIVVEALMRLHQRGGLPLAPDVHTTEEPRAA